jgi:hypothetical protein
MNKIELGNTGYRMPDRYRIGYRTVNSENGREAIRTSMNTWRETVYTIGGKGVMGSCGLGEGHEE